MWEDIFHIIKCLNNALFTGFGVFTISLAVIPLTVFCITSGARRGGPGSPARDQVTGRGLAVRSREAARRRGCLHSCARLFGGRCSPALFYPAEGYKETERHHEIEREHESRGGSRGTRANQLDYSAAQTRILEDPDGAPQMHALDFTHRRV